MPVSPYHVRVGRSIDAILELFNLKANQIKIARKELPPNKIYVSATEECDFGTAKKLSRTKYAKRLPAPITILKHKNKHIIFLGSNRSLVYMIKGRYPDCVIVELPNKMKVPTMIKEPKYTLKEIWLKK